MERNQFEFQRLLISLTCCAFSLVISPLEADAKGHKAPHHAPPHHNAPKPKHAAHHEAKPKQVAKAKPEKAHRVAEKHHEPPKHLAANNFDKEHPRRAEVIHRDNHLEHRIAGDRHNLGRNFDRLRNDADSIRKQEQADAKKNGGYITKGEQKQLNREENGLKKEVAMDNSKNKFVQNHSRRAEVLGRAGDMNFAINQDKGHLKGQYGKLAREDKSIISQEQREAKQNGGHITNQEQGQLNREENNLNQQIQKDSH
jgi:hypothetical protein